MYQGTTFQVTTSRARSMPVSASDRTCSPPSDRCCPGTRTLSLARGLSAVWALRGAAGLARRPRPPSNRSTGWRPRASTPADARRTPSTARRAARSEERACARLQPAPGWSWAHLSLARRALPRHSYGCAARIRHDVSMSLATSPTPSTRRLRGQLPVRRTSPSGWRSRPCSRSASRRPPGQSPYPSPSFDGDSPRSCGARLRR